VQLIAIVVDVNGALTWLVKTSRVERRVPAKPATKRGQIKHFARFKPMNTMAILASDADCNIDCIRISTD